MWLGRNVGSETAPQFSVGTRLAQQPDAVAATNAADRSWGIGSTAYAADRPWWIGSTADAAD
jgi:hypothetical protein